MSGGSLPKTGMGALSVGAVSFTLPQLGITAVVVGVGLVAISAIAVRFQFRRHRSLSN